MTIDIKIIKFDNTKIEKHNFHQHKKPILTDNIDINKIVVCNKVFSIKTILITLLATKMLKNRLLSIFHLKRSAYRRDFGKSKCMSFLIKDEKLFGKYNEIWKISKY